MAWELFAERLPWLCGGGSSKWSERSDDRRTPSGWPVFFLAGSDDPIFFRKPSELQNPRGNSWFVKRALPLNLIKVVQGVDSKWLTPSGWHLAS